MKSRATKTEDLKKVVKTALLEILEQRGDLLQDACAEALEDFALSRAIREGESSGTAERATIFKLLQAKS